MVFLIRLILGLFLFYVAISSGGLGGGLIFLLLAVAIINSGLGSMEKTKVQQEQLEYYRKANQKAEEKTTDITCSHCGTVNAGTSVFCNQCGQALKKQEE